METKKNRFKDLLSKLKKWISHNAGLKILSLIFSAVLWLTIVNYTNPEVSVTVKTNIDVRNVEELSKSNTVFPLDENTVSITYKVRSGNRAKITPADFSAYVDLSDYTITGAVPVYVDVKDDAAEMVSEVSHEPLVVHVNAEAIVRRRFKISGVVDGSAAEGCVIGEMRHEPEAVYISGTKSELARISNVSFHVDVNNAKEDIHGSENIVVSDADGKNLNANVKLEPYDKVDYTLKIYKTKTLTVKTSTEGHTREGYVVDSIETSPTFVSVYGDDSILKEIQYITIPRSELNITDAYENMTFNLDINDYLPEGLHLNQANSQLVVLIKVRHSVMQVQQEIKIVNPEPVVETSSAEESGEGPREDSEESLNDY